MLLLLTFIVNYAIIASICKLGTLFLDLLVYFGFRELLTQPMNDAIVFYLPVAALIGFTLLAISPAGESYYLWRNRARKPLRKEAEVIEPLFRSVVSAANRGIPNFNRSCDFYNIRVIDDLMINAYAVGRKTVIVNTGTLTLPPEEVDGILAHELGHLHNRDSSRLLISSSMEAVGEFFIGILHMLTALLGWIPFLGIILVIIPYLVTALLDSLIKLPICICRAFGGRREEYKADRFACDIGHDEQIEKLLTRLHGFSWEGQPTTLITQFMESHPMLAERLRKVERFRDEKAYGKRGR